MGNRVSREEFLKLAEELLQDGPEVKYQNPDAWTNQKLKQALEEEIKKRDRGRTENPP
jgi:hypothetical protein